MAGSVNKVMLIGNLGADPEIKSFQNGGRIANLRIATSETGRTSRPASARSAPNGTMSCSIPTVWSASPNAICARAKVYIEGQLRTRKWQDQSGNDRYTTEVSVGGMGGVLTMLDGAPGGGQGGGGQRGGGSGGGNDWGGGSSGGGYGGGQRSGGGTGGGFGGASQAGGFADDLDDDIPF
jgi:single-strand DNA-binding protein